MARIFTPKDEIHNPDRNFTTQEELINRVVATVVRCVSGIESGACDDLASLAVSDALEPDLAAIEDIEVYKGHLLTCGFDLGMRVTIAVMSNAAASQDGVHRALQIACDDLDKTRIEALAEAKLAS